MTEFYATYVVPLSALIPIFIGLRNYPSLPFAFRVLLIFTIIGSLVNLASMIIMAQHHYTVYLIHLYSIAEFSSVAFAFSVIFKQKWRLPIYLLIAAYDVLCIVNYLFIQNKIEYNTYTRPIGALFIVVFCMFYTMRNVNEEQKWSDDSFNWINTGLLMYYSVGVIIFISFNFFLTKSIFSDIIWGFHNTVLLIEYILFAIGFYKCKSLTTTISLS